MRGIEHFSLSNGDFGKLPITKENDRTTREKLSKGMWYWLSGMLVW